MEYPFELVDDIIIWYHPKLQIQQGYQSIVIHVKRCPVTIRFLDPPLHEFVPTEEADIKKTRPLIR